MAAIAPYPKYSDYSHVTSSDLLSKRSEVITAIFPNNLLGRVQISAFLVLSSAGGYTLLLGDALSFVGLRNSTDTLREVSPVIFDCVSRSCSTELQQAVRSHGRAITGSPPLVALEIDLDTRNCFSKLFYPSYSGPDPQVELIRVISAQADEVYIGKYRIKKMANTWQPPAARPHWQGLAFEQSDRVIRTWLHAPNPQALQSARDAAQSLIDRSVEAERRKQTEINNQTAQGRYRGQRKKQLDGELAAIRQTLQEQRNHLQYLTAQTVNSAAQTTLQCAITMQVNQADKIRLLERFICQRIVTTIDCALGAVSWEELQIGTATIESFIRQKFNALEQRIPILAERSARSEPAWDTSEGGQPALTMGRGGTLTDRVQFRDEVMPWRKAWLQQNFQQFCQEKVGHPVPTHAERPSLEREWKQELSKKLKWVTDRLRKSDDDLKIMENHTFVDIDIRIFDAHRQHMLQILRRGDQHTYGLSLELDKLYRERDFLRTPARHHNSVHLVKRIATGGEVYFGVAPSPTNPTDRPDPNSSLNEVHIPVLNVPNPFQQGAQNPRLPQRASSSTWKWVAAAGVALVAGAWFAYLKQQSAWRSVEQ